MQNITLSVDEKIIKKVRRIALERETTLTALVREYLIGLTSSYDSEKDTAIDKLERSFDIYSREIGEQTWNREELHERT